MLANLVLLQVPCVICYHIDVTGDRSYNVDGMVSLVVEW